MPLDTIVAGRHTHAGGHACPACGGLECLERPRFFAGQLLTEAELNSDQAYVLAKNRLHNRYLHGPGVVCGLQVACDPCDGWVTVAPGYAIDPCGNDIVVCAQERLNVLELIARCRDRGATTTPPCDPVRDTSSRRRGDCRAPEEHWCVTVAYEERETRAATVLRRQASTGSCRCDANGNGNGGCSCGHGTTATVTATARSSSTVAMGACEPTRILEAFRLDVCESEPGPCRTQAEAVQGSLLWEIVGCISELSRFVQRRVPQRSFQPLAQALFTRELSGTPQDQFDAYCYLRQALYELAANGPLGVRCTVADTLDRIVLQAPPNEDDGTYAAQAQVALQALAAVAWQYVLDCICQRLLPPCPPDPVDDRLTLACLTIVDGRITEICNFGCREYSGSWPALYRWLSLVPVLPLLGALVESVCCTEWMKPERGKEGNRFTAGLDHVDPTFRRSRMYENDFSQVSDLLAGLARVRANLTASNLPTALGDPNDFAELLRRAFRDEG